MCVYGGVPRRNQAIRIDAGVDIVIATPGRCADLANSGLLDLSKVTYLVLDEADSMMDMGFEHQIRQVVNQLPTARQSLFFSATWPVGVQSLASEFLRDPIQVNLGEIDVPNANKSIKQRIIVMQESDKENSLINLLSNLETNFVSGAKMVPKIIIFVARKNDCDVLKKKICKLGYDADALHGDKTQAEREKNLEIFRRGKGKILIATDVASRGLDVKDIDIVINYDFPVGSVAVESYVHRIGRTARGERTGTAYTFFTQKSSLHVNKMCELLDRSEQPIPSALRNMMSGSSIHENRIENTDENEHENGHENNHDYSSEDMNENMREYSPSKISDYDNNDKLRSKSSTYDDYDELKMISPRNYDGMYNDDDIDNTSQEDIIKTEELKKKKIHKKSSIHGVFLRERISKKV
jgi:ATP-dependent RNA helicase DDX5/DBP2